MSHCVSPGPLDRSATEAVNAIWEGVALASVAVTASKHNGLNSTVQFRQGYLQSASSVVSHRLKQRTLQRPNRSLPRAATGA